MNSTAKAKKQYSVNTAETFRESVMEVTDTVKTQVGASVDDLWRQLLGGGETSKKAPSMPQRGDLSAGQVIDFTEYKKTTVTVQKEPVSDRGKVIDAKDRFIKRSEAAPGINYHSEILHGEKRISRETEQQLTRQIQEIAAELKQIVSASQELATQFKDVAVEQRMVKPGKYHLNLFQFILTVLRQARMKVENSSTCLSISKGKKAKQDYWSQFNDKGTSFSMNNERAIATQAG